MHQNDHEQCKAYYIVCYDYIVGYFYYCIFHGLLYFEQKTLKLDGSPECTIIFRLKCD